MQLGGLIGYGWVFPESLALREKRNRDENAGGNPTEDCVPDWGHVAAFTTSFLLINKMSWSLRVPDTPRGDA